jgi:signal transduction histidine kinase
MAEEPVDRLLLFRPAILGTRWGTAGIGLVLAGAGNHDNNLTMAAWSFVVVGYCLFRTLRPLSFREDVGGLIAVLADVGIHVIAVDATGYWQSPFVFSLITAIIIAGFARGFAFALRVAVVSALAVGVPDHVSGNDELRIGAQWSCEFVLVALVAGYARRISGEADLQHSLTLDRMGRLADANSLLFSLHRLAQTLPASLDLDEALDATVGRLRDLFDFKAAAVLLYDDTDRSWVVARREGTRLPTNITAEELPPGLRRALETRSLVHEPNLLQTGGPGLAPRMYSGLYSVLLARGAVIGLISLEHTEAHHFSQRDGELLGGFAEPAALAIDNARWFGRLRTIGAEEERTRIARDLHDRIGQSLAYLAFELDRIVKSNDRGDLVSGSLEQLRTDIREVIGDVRDTLYDLRTDVSEEQDIVTVLELYLDRVRDRSGLEIILRAKAAGRLPLVQERELFRIIQEALANVEKHARASRVIITWSSDGRAALLEISDDGDGFPIGRAGRLDSYGIVGMRERAASIGATLEIDSAPGNGTRVRCLLGLATPRPTLLGLRRALN